MKAMLQTKIGLFLIVSSVLAAWTLLAARPALAQTKSAPGCPSSSEISSINDGDNTDTIDGQFQGEIKVGKTKGELEVKDKALPTDEEHYVKIVVPPLTSGDLTVKISTKGLIARLCEGDDSIAADHLEDGETAATREAMIPAEPVSKGDYYLVVEGASSTDITKITYIVTATFSGVVSTETSDAGSISTAREQDSYKIEATVPGLLTVYTTGNTDTKGALRDDKGEIAADEDSGDGGNFQIVIPVKANDKYTVNVEGQDRDDTGDYTLVVDFKVSMETVKYPTPGKSKEYTIGAGEAEYFFISPTKAGFMTVETSGSTDTEGTLFGPDGEITTDDDTGTDDNFLIQAPVSKGNYVVKVEGQSSSTTGKYKVVVSQKDATPKLIPSKATDGTIEKAVSGSSLNVYHFLLDIETSGTLQVKTTGDIDTVGTLYGPDGQQLATDNDSGARTNFRMTVSVAKGQHIVAVEGQTRDTAGSYTLVVNFIEGAALGGTNGRVAELEAEVERLEAALEDCPTAVVTHAKGFLENPSNDGFRSGIGIISGWVCAASDVEVQILSDRGVLRETLDVAYGTSRADTVGQCRHRSANTGFGMTYNFNHLPEGMHTIRAYADDEQIGEDETFEVVHLTTFAANDDDRFLRNLPAADECRVDDFPAAGEDTFLKWEESIQNFVIEDAG